MRRIVDYGKRGQVTVVSDAREVALLATEELVVANLRALRQARPAYVALSGGSTPKKMYDIFKEPLFRRRVDWSHMQFFWGDERWVPIDDEESNAGEARRGFIDEIELDEEHYHPWATHLGDPTEAASGYEATIRIVTNSLDETPVLDLVLLGMGTDGHTASLFPGTDAVHEQEHLTVAHTVPQLDATRLTMTPRLLNNANDVLFLVNGTAKAESLHRVLDGPIDIDTTPSQVIRPTHGRLRWYVDEAAAAQLEKG